MKFESFTRGAVRGLLALATVIVTTDTFAQARGTGTPRSRLGGMRRNGQETAGAGGNAAGAAGSTAERPANKEVPTFNWDAAAVDIVLQAYADMLEKTYLKDPAVPNATITLKSREGQKLTKEEYLEAIEVVLEMNGIHVEPYADKFIRVLPRKDARKEGIPLITDPDTRLNESGRVVSMMIPFKNIGIEEAKAALENFVSANGGIIPFERTNSFLATDTEQNINRMLEIAKLIDVARPVQEQVYVRQIKHTTASRIQALLKEIVEESQKEQEKDAKGSSALNNNGGNSMSRQFGNSPRFGGNNANRKPNEQAPATSSPSLVVTVSDADRGMIRGKVQILADDEHSNKLVIITQPANMRFFDSIIEQLDIETTPDTVVKVYRLKYADAEEVSDMINDLIGNASSKSGKENSNRNAKTGTGANVTRGTSPTAANAPRQSANQRSGEPKAGELSKDNTTVLADKRINGIIVMTEKSLVDTVEQIIESMDVKLSQVLIETVIIEVKLGDELKTGMDWVQHGRETVNKQVTDTRGMPLYYAKRTVTDDDGNVSVSFLNDLVPKGWKSSSTYGESGSIIEEASDVAGTAAQISTEGLLNYFTAGSATAFGAGQGGKLAYSATHNIVSNFFGSALNFVFKSDELGLSAILQATKTDSRSKYIASPIIMTLDNKEATINATEMRYLLKGFTSSGNSYSTIAVPDYEQKELGIEIKTTPKINPNGTVMLTVEEKYTQLGSYQTIQYATGSSNGGSSSLQDVPVPTTITREMSSDVLLESNQTVVFAGLTQTTKDETETGIPILKDIPWIGKWLFSKTEQNEYRTELLVFMTPYVLNDAEATQAEALRRKRTMSDPNPWDDRGWSLSELADPVSKKEQMRRLRDEWRKQDEERKTRIALEQEKVKRVKALEKMSKEERKLWLEMHKDELKEEEQDELEEKMLDDQSQEELKKLAAQVRERKLQEADAALKNAADETAAENERAKFDREKTEKAEQAETAESPAEEEKPTEPLTSAQ